MSVYFSEMSGVESLESVQLADWLDKQLKQRRLELKDRERQTLIGINCHDEFHL